MVADAMITLGVAQWALGDLTAAAATHDEARRLFRSVGDRWGATVSSILRARTARDADDPGAAASLLDDALDDARAIGDAHVLGLALDQMARLALDAGDHARAAFAARECLAANEAIGYAEGVASALHVLAQARAGAGDVEAARDLQLRALQVAQRIGHAGGICESFEMLAGLAAARRDDAWAARLLHHADRMRSRRNVPLVGRAVVAGEALQGQVRERLGPAWDELRARTPLESPDELIAQLLAER
jgi:tetratricopeptide (TPR) repeat protein